MAEDGGAHASGGALIAAAAESSDEQLVLSGSGLGLGSLAAAAGYCSHQEQAQTHESTHDALVPESVACHVFSTSRDG
jgi:hypothetical protein